MILKRSEIRFVLKIQDCKTCTIVPASISKDLWTLDRILFLFLFNMAHFKYGLGQAALRKKLRVINKSSELDSQTLPSKMPISVKYRQNRISLLGLSIVPGVGYGRIWGLFAV